MKGLSTTVLEQIIDQLDHAVLVLDANRKARPIVYVNQRFEDLTGFAASEALGQPADLLQGPDTDEAILADFEQAMQDERAHSAPLTYHRKDGSEFDSHLKAIPLRSRSGRLTHWLWCVASNALSSESDADIVEHGSVTIGIDDLVAHDRLTGIHSRKFFEALLERRWTQASEDNGSLSLFMIEIDAFKEYNETFGRQASDSCLRLVARAITGALRRASDVGARFADEEFVALVCDLEPKNALSLAKRIRERVSALCIHHPRSGVAKYVSVSIGVANIRPSDNSKAARLIRDSRAALEKAKEAGRNTIKEASNG